MGVPPACGKRRLSSLAACRRAALARGNPRAAFFRAPPCATQCPPFFPPNVGGFLALDVGAAPGSVINRSPGAPTPTTGASKPAGEHVRPLGRMRPLYCLRPRRRSGSKGIGRLPLSLRAACGTCSGQPKAARYHAAQSAGVVSSLRSFLLQPLAGNRGRLSELATLVSASLPFPVSGCASAAIHSLRDT